MVILYVKLTFVHKLASLIFVADEGMDQLAVCQGAGCLGGVDESELLRQLAQA